MKQPKKLTSNQKKLLCKNKLDPASYSLVAETKKSITILNKYNKEIKEVKK